MPSFGTIISAANFSPPKLRNKNSRDSFDLYLFLISTQVLPLVPAAFLANKSPLILETILFPVIKE